jgi:hypothetical protein
MENEEEFMPFGLLILRYFILFMRVITVYLRSKQLNKKHRNNFEFDKNSNLFE